MVKNFPQFITNTTDLGKNINKHASGNIIFKQQKNQRQREVLEKNQSKKKSFYLQSNEDEYFCGLLRNDANYKR